MAQVVNWRNRLILIAIVTLLLQGFAGVVEAAPVFNVDAYDTAPGTPSNGDLVFNFQTIGPQTYTAYITSFAMDGSILNVVQGNVKGTMPSFSLIAGTSDDVADFSQYLSIFNSALAHFPFSTAKPLSWDSSSDAFSGASKAFPSWTHTDFTIFPTAWTNLNNVIGTYGLGTLPAVDINGLYTWSPTVFLVYGTVTNVGGGVIGGAGPSAQDPEPATVILLGAGLISLLLLRRHSRVSNRKEIA